MAKGHAPIACEWDHPSSEWARGASTISHTCSMTNFFFSFFNGLIYINGVSILFVFNQLTGQSFFFFFFVS